MTDTICSSSDEEEILTYKLKIHDADLSDAGRWQCEVKDKYGTVSTACDLSVFENIKRQSLTSASRKTVLNGTSVNGTGSDSEEEILTYRLKIHNANVKDAGRWKCEVEDKYGSASTTCDVDIFDKATTLKESQIAPVLEEPRFLMSLRDVTAIEGQSLKLICRVKGIPLPAVVWYKNGNPVSKDDYGYQVLYLKDGTISLEIFHPSPTKDAALFKCVAENEKGAVSSECKVTVISKKREGSSSRESLSSYSRSRYYSAEREGSLSRDYTSSSSRSKYNSSEREGSLSRDYTSSSRSKYNSADREGSLSRNYTSSSSRSKYNSAELEGSLSRDYTSSSSRSKYYSADREGSLSRDYTSSSSRSRYYSTDREGSLYRDYTSRSNRPSSSRYYSSEHEGSLSRNNIGSSSRSYLSERGGSMSRDHLSSSSRYGRGRSETRRATSESRLTGRASSETCYSTSSSLISKSTKTLQDYYLNRKSDVKWSYEDIDSSSSDTCKSGYSTQKFFDSSEIDPEMKLDVRYGTDEEFYFQENLKNKCINEGSRLFLSAYVIGKLPIFVQWYKDGNCLARNIYERHSIRTRAGHVSLEIPVTELYDTGDYSVDIRNEQGRINSSCYIQIEPRYKHDLEFGKPTFLEGIHHVHVNEGQTATFQVVARGNPRPGITWFKDGQRIQTTEKITIHTGKKGGSLLMIHDCDFTDMGLYKVEAHNYAGRCSGSAKLTVFGLKVVEVVKSIPFEGESGTRFCCGEDGDFKIIKRRDSLDEDSTNEDITISSVKMRGQKSHDSYSSRYSSYESRLKTKISDDMSISQDKSTKGLDELDIEISNRVQRKNIKNGEIVSEEMESSKVTKSFSAASKDIKTTEQSLESTEMLKNQSEISSSSSEKTEKIMSSDFETKTNSMVTTSNSEITESKSDSVILATKSESVNSELTKKDTELSHDASKSSDEKTLEITKDTNLEEKLKNESQMSEVEVKTSKKSLEKDTTDSNLKLAIAASILAEIENTDKTSSKKRGSLTRQASGENQDDGSRRRSSWVMFDSMSVKNKDDLTSKSEVNGKTISRKNSIEKSNGMSNGRKLSTDKAPLSKKNSVDLISEEEKQAEESKSVEKQAKKLEKEEIVKDVKSDVSSKTELQDASKEGLTVKEGDEKVDSLAIETASSETSLATSGLKSAGEDEVVEMVDNQSMSETKSLNVESSQDKMDGAKNEGQQKSEDLSLNAEKKSELQLENSASVVSTDVKEEKINVTSSVETIASSNEVKLEEKQVLDEKVSLTDNLKEEKSVESARIKDEKSPSTKEEKLEPECVDKTPETPITEQRSDIKNSKSEPSTSDNNETLEKTATEIIEDQADDVKTEAVGMEEKVDTKSTTDVKTEAVGIEEKVDKKSTTDVKTETVGTEEKVDTKSTTDVKTEAVGIEEKMDKKSTTDVKREAVGMEEKVDTKSTTDIREVTEEKGDTKSTDEAKGDKEINEQSLFRSDKMVPSENEAQILEDESTIENEKETIYTTSPNIVKFLPKWMEIKEGEILQLECLVAGEPKPKVIWLHNSKKISSSSTHISITSKAEYHNLEIQQTDFERDSGTYTLRASNISGENESTCEVKIEGKPKNVVEVTEEKTDVKTEEKLVDENKTDTVSSDQTDSGSKMIKEIDEKTEKRESEKVDVEEVQNKKAKPTNAEETKAEKVVAEEKKANKMVAEETKAEKVVAEETKADKVVAEETKADKVVAEETKADKVVAEETKADTVVAEETKADKVVAEETKADKVVAEETKADKVVAEETKAEKVVAEETKAEKVVAEETISENIVDEETKSKKLAVEETKSEKIEVVQTKSEKLLAEETKAEKMVAVETNVEKKVTEVTKAQKIDIDQTKPEILIVEETKSEKVVAEETQVEKMVAEETRANKIEIEIRSEKSVVEESKDDRMVVEETMAEKRDFKERRAKSMVFKETVEGNMDSSSLHLSKKSSVKDDVDQRSLCLKSSVLSLKKGSQPENCCAHFSVPLHEEYHPMERDEDVRLYVKVGGEPLSPAQWYKDGEELEPSRRVLINWDMETQESTVVIRRFKLIDAGEYECVILTDKGPISTHTVLHLIRLESQRVESQVHMDASEITDVPLILYPIKDTSVYKGQEAYFECAVDKRPNINVRWLKDGRDISQKKRKYIFKESKGVHSLTVEDIEESDCGNYTFEASDGEEMSTVTASIILEVEKIKNIDVGPPKVTEQPDSIVGVAAGIILRCCAEANPPAKFQWQKDMVDITQSRRVVVSLPKPGESILKISDVTYSDRGMYVCVVKNRLGRVKTRCSLHVGGEFEERGKKKKTEKQIEKRNKDDSADDEKGKKTSIQIVEEKIDTESATCLTERTPASDNSVETRYEQVSAKSNEQVIVKSSEQVNVMTSFEETSSKSSNLEETATLIVTDAIDGAKIKAEMEEMNAKLERERKEKLAHEVAEKDRIAAERAILLAKQEAEKAALLAKEAEEARLKAEETKSEAESEEVERKRKEKLAQEVAEKDRILAEKAALLAKEETEKARLKAEEEANARKQTEEENLKSEEVQKCDETPKPKKKHRLTFEEAEKLRLEEEEKDRSKHKDEEEENTRLKTGKGEKKRLEAEKEATLKVEETVKSEESQISNESPKPKKKHRLTFEEAEKLRLEEEEKERTDHKAEAEEEARLKAEAEKQAQLKAEEEEKARLKAEAEEQAKVKAEEEEKARLKAEAEKQARLKTEEEEKARLKAEAEEQARLKAEAEEQARLKAEAERQARLKAEAEEQARLKAEEEKKARLKAEEEEKARLKAEEEEKVRLKAEQEEKARLKAEAEEKARLKAEEEEKARLKAEEEEKARLKAVEEEKARLKAVEEEKARLKAEEEEKARLKAEEEEKAKLKVEAEENARLKAEEEEKARLKAEEEEKARLKAEAEERERLKAEAEEKARLKAEAEEKARLKTEQEVSFIKQVEEEKVKSDESQKSNETPKPKKKHRLTFEEAEKLRLEEEQTHNIKKSSLDVESSASLSTTSQEIVGGVNETSASQRLVSQEEVDGAVVSKMTNSMRKRSSTQTDISEGKLTELDQSSLEEISSTQQDMASEIRHQLNRQLSAGGSSLEILEVSTQSVTMATGKMSTTHHGIAHHHIHHPPEIILRPDSKRVPTHSELELMVRVKASRHAKVSWVHDGTPVQFQGQKHYELITEEEPIKE